MCIFSLNIVSDTHTHTYTRSWQENRSKNSAKAIDLHVFDWDFCYSIFRHSVLYFAYVCITNTYSVEIPLIIYNFPHTNRMLCDWDMISSRPKWKRMSRTLIWFAELNVKHVVSVMFEHGLPFIQYKWCSRSHTTRVSRFYMYTFDTFRSVHELVSWVHEIRTCVSICVAGRCARLRKLQLCQCQVIWNVCGGFWRCLWGAFMS